MNLLGESLTQQQITFVDANSDTGYTSLSEMSDGTAARNNCYNAAEAVAKELHQENHDAVPVGLIFNSAEHWATLIYSGDNDATVIDYTMRQFAVGSNVPEEKIPFPFIARYEDWQATIEGWAAARWDETLQEIETEEISVS